MTNIDDFMLDHPVASIALALATGLLLALLILWLT